MAVPTSSSSQHFPPSSTLRTTTPRPRSRHGDADRRSFSKPLHSFSSSDIVISQDAAPLIGKASNDSSLVRSILAAFGKEILEFASDRFLDLALELQLKIISTRDLVILLAKADRLGYSETDIIDNKKTVY
jgi:hypothetical protein